MVLFLWVSCFLGKIGGEQGDGLTTTTSIVFRQIDVMATNMLSNGCAKVDLLLRGSETWQGDGKNFGLQLVVNEDHGDFMMTMQQKQTRVFSAITRVSS